VKRGDARRLEELVKMLDFAFSWRFFLAAAGPTMCARYRYPYRGVLDFAIFLVSWPETGEIFGLRNFHEGVGLSFFAPSVRNW